MNFRTLNMNNQNTLRCLRTCTRPRMPLAHLARGMMSEVNTATRKPRAEGTIASVFASLSGEKEAPLPDRFIDLKRQIIDSPAKQDAVRRSFTDLIRHLKVCADDIASRGSSIIPEVDYTDIAAGSLPTSTIQEIKKRGVVITRNVVPEAKALEWLESIKSYIAANPKVKGFPEADKQVFELYWSKAQLEARSHPSSLATQTFLLSLFQQSTSSRTPSSQVSLTTPLTYCDRLRIRKPGDSQFALGPHVDGGSVERWEDPMYRMSYQKVLEGKWREHDPWDMASRPEANMNMYDGPGSCGVFRALQGWTSLSTTGPNEGTLKVYPLVRESSAYMMLRPFFTPVLPASMLSKDEFLAPENWQMDLDSPRYPGSPLGRGQEFSDETHPHLETSRTMVPLKQVKPGDMAWWHCDGIHSVESANNGTNASSVLYIPAVPLTIANAHYVRDQRESFKQGIPPPDFPGGVGESQFRGRGEVDDLAELGGVEGRGAMGLMLLEVKVGMDAKEKALREQANQILG